MQKIIYPRGVTCGAFDLMHRGHMMMFKECKRHCDKLTVFLQTDPSLDRPEKHKPVMSIEERLTLLRGVKYIDEIVIYRTEAELYDLLKRLPAGTVRVIGADWKGKQYTGWDLPLPVIFNSRGHNYSTSELRRRVFLAEKQLIEAPVLRKAEAAGHSPSLFNRRILDRIGASH